jgi:hypothetical protein
MFSWWHNIFKTVFTSSPDRSDVLSAVPRFRMRWKSDEAKPGLNGGWSKTVKSRHWISATTYIPVCSLILMCWRELVACEDRLNKCLQICSVPTNHSQLTMEAVCMNTNALHHWCSKKQWTWLCQQKAQSWTSLVLANLCDGDSVV